MPRIQQASSFWCFTINNPTIDDIIDLDFAQPQWNNLVKFAIYAEETGTLGTTHYQGYLELGHHKTLSWLKKRMKRAHFEFRRSTRENAILYCLKTYDHTSSEDLIPQPILWNPSEPSMTWKTMKNDLISAKNSNTNGALEPPRKKILQQMKTMIDEGATNLDLANFSFPTYISCYRGLNNYRLLIQPKRNHETKVLVCQGPTGTGKSKWCMDNFPNAYWKQRSNWWDNYKGEETVIIDEFYGWLPFDLILRICDRYPLLVEIKGGQTQFTAKTVIFTSNSTPDRWYKKAYMQSFYRRVHEWHIFPIWGEHIFFDDYESALLRMINNE